MHYARILLLTVSVLAVAAFVYADNPFQIGFETGYKQGLVDKRSGEDFDFEDSDRYQEGISNSSYVNSQFRAGFKDGYLEGYRNGESRSETTRIRIYSNDDDDDETIYVSEGFATGFQRTAFRGGMRQFPVGHYPDLDDEGWEDEIESIQVSGNVRVVLFDRENFKGQSLILENDSADLDELNFKARAASMIVEPQ